MVEKTSFDVVIIGGGPGGYVAAIRASQLGLKTAVIEREHMGGICLNWGCIPTKALLRTAEVYHLMHHAADFGLKAEKISFDLKAVVDRSRKISRQLSAGISHLMRKHKVTVLSGQGKLLGKGVVAVSEGKTQTHEVSAKHIILATGARARELPHIKVDGKHIVSYREAMIPDTMPKTLAVLGSGAIGSEFASFYGDMGVDVTLFEVQDRILPVEDAEISAFAQKAFEKRGIKVFTKTKVIDTKVVKGQVEISYEQAGKTHKVTVDRLISAVGIVANTENLGLESTKVQLDKGHIKIDAYCKTDEPGVYAIGDVVGAPWLAHKASHEAIICVEKLAGVKDVHPLNVTNIPGCTYCRPQVASVGLTEQQAKDKGYKVKVGRFPFMGNGKAIALGEPEGFVKTLFDEKTGELLGAHMIGAEVTELIQGFVVARTLETTEAELMHTIFPHPTLSEMMHESVLDAYGKALHI